MVTLEELKSLIGDVLQIADRLADMVVTLAEGQAGTDEA